MSGHSAAGEIPEAAVIEDEAAGWVVDRGNQQTWTPERQAELDFWLARSVAHRVAFVRIESSWKRADRLAALRGPMREVPARTATPKDVWGRIAAVFGFAIVTGLFATNYFSQPDTQLIETPKGGQERLLLADGSQIELNTESAIRIGLRNNRRSVELLRGEAYFQIRHDRNHPFVVRVADHKIIDLGTRFTVRTAHGSLQVALLEGRVRLDSASAPDHLRSVTLLPGEVAVATAEAIRVNRVSAGELADRLAWQHGGLVFHNTSLADAVAEFNRYGGQPLVLKNLQAAGLTINGRFRVSGAEDFASNVHELFGLRVEHRNGAIVLTR